ncbi:glycoside hydrolase family 16 protein [Stereum hirsutum FP-91666 SS1]|uniref:glycoside hydrolase family 16 protein n=1 Tax=Stereum hirsutum (strain FP-91666) TaxID=721885 RepID=UPI000444A4B9|nr:glycoside hydrolase family 16 protein [Stereum hirsutum FP-91666 SS1]EIM83185.1 glycoside hydrolase family 16 protein [Stereum hirsutum FP-91666 SS1]
MHDPKETVVDEQLWHKRGWGVSYVRGVANLGCLVIMILAVVMLFAGYPVLSHFDLTAGPPTLSATFLNATSQYPGLIDTDTPSWAYTKTSWHDGSELQLVFSDEFEKEGRTFSEGDDPYWEAVNLHYWETNNLEWYDPAAVTTANGSMVITLSRHEEYNLDYQSGMVTTWNKFCFTGGYVETSVVLPGFSNIIGLWPAVWTVGNLGRTGYGATLDGLWPYTYDACDIGTVANQSLNGLPSYAAETGYTFTEDGGDGTTVGGPLSYLGGQRLSRCTCPGESHPGPVHEDGTFVGRSAPEIDIIEGQISNTFGGVMSGQVSQSCQWAPFNAFYSWDNTTGSEIYNETVTSALNSYKGGRTQQATSVISETDQDCYQFNGSCFSVYGYEYKPGFDDAYITWIAKNATAWTLKAEGMKADPRTEISDRPIPQEPMYIIANLGMSYNFGDIDFDDLVFPATMHIDYIRVYQRPDSINVDCDPPDFPTAAYISQYEEAYTNPNLTTWVNDYGQSVPKSSYLGEC